MEEKIAKKRGLYMHRRHIINPDLNDQMDYLPYI